MAKKTRRGGASCPDNRDDYDGHNDGEIVRTPNGRFQKGFCPNRLGRGGKPKVSPNEVLLRVLEEKMPGSGQGGRGAMTVHEALVRSACSQGFKNARIALALLRLAEEGGLASPVDEEVADPSAEDDDLIADFVSREERRRTRVRSRNGDDGAEGGGDE